jgi:hypothetical protein
VEIEGTSSPENLQVVQGLMVREPVFLLRVRTSHAIRREKEIRTTQMLGAVKLSCHHRVRRLRQEGHEFEANLVYIVKPCLEGRKGVGRSRTDQKGKKLFIFKCLSPLKMPRNIPK